MPRAPIVPAGDGPGLPRRTLVAVLVWLSLTGAVFGGRLATTDVSAQLDVAGSFIGARPLLTAESGWLVQGSDGRRYVPHGIGWSAILVPAAALGLLAGADAAGVAAALTCSLFSVALVWAWARLCTVRNGSPPSATRMVLLAVCSTALTWSRMPYDVTAAAFLCTLSLCLALEGRDLAAGAAIGAALVVRLDSVVFLPALVTGRRSWRLLPGVLAAAAVIASANLLRFGSILEDGHSQDPAMAFAPGPAGLAGLLVSPGKGLLWFAPAAFLAIRGHRGPRLALPLILSLLLHSQLADWTGGTGWGPRFLFTAIPAFMVPLASPGRPGRLFHAAAAWSMAITAASAWSSPTEVEQAAGEIAFETRSRQEAIWNPSRSPLVHSLQAFGRGSPDLFAVHASRMSPAHGTAALALQAAWAGAPLALALAVSRRRLVR